MLDKTMKNRLDCHPAATHAHASTSKDVCVEASPIGYSPQLRAEQDPG